MRFLDGRLTAEEATALGAELRTSAEARRFLREVAFQATALADIARSRSLRTPPPHVAPARRTRPPLRWALTAAAVVALVITSLVTWQRRETPEVVVVTELAGAANWTGADGRLRSGLAAGDQLTAGTIETEDDMARVQLCFADGTRLTLAGNTELAFSNDGQKRLRLKRGYLTADVAPQPAGRPLIVETATAKLEVLGTLFAVTTASDGTLLNVEKGSVLLRRLVDGRTVEVPAQHSAVASLDAADKLVAGRPPAPPRTWRMSFEPRPRGWLGDWEPAAGVDAPARIRAIPFQAGRKPDGMPVIHRGIRCMSQRDLNPTGFVSLSADTVVRLRCRYRQPSPLQIFLGTHKPTGSFAGNFEAKIPEGAGEADADGWRRLEIAVSTMRSLGGASPQDVQVHYFHVGSYDMEKGLELAEVAIGPPQLLDKISP